MIFMSNKTQDFLSDIISEQGAGIMRKTEYNASSFSPNISIPVGITDKPSIFRLQDLLRCAKLLGVSEYEFSDNKTMRQINQELMEHILTEVHPYKIYQSGKEGRWFTYIHDPSRPRNRKLIKRTSYEAICETLVEHYRKKLHMDMKMRELFDDWAIFRRDETSAKAGTVRKDVGMWRTHIQKVMVDRKQLGNYKVCDITPGLLYSFFRAITKDRELTRQMVNNIRGVLSGMMSYAVERGIIQANPVRDVDISRLSYKPVPDKSDDVFSSDEAEKLLMYLENITDEPYALAIRLDFNLFIRVGELTGLMWDNVDLDKREVYICHQVTYEPDLKDDLTFTSKKQVMERYLKGCTSQGYRREYLTDEAVEILKLAKKLNPDGEFVFMPNQKPMLTLTFNKRLRKYCREAGVPYRSSHKIRFYAASTAYDGQNLVTISRMMGHSQTSTTLHYLRNVDRNEDFSEVFSKLGRRNNR